MLNILFTSIGRRVELVRAFRHAYQQLNLNGNIIATDIDPLAPALEVVDRHYIVPRLNTLEYIPTLVEICRRESIRLVFPLIDPDIPVLAQHRQQIEATGARLAVVPFEAACCTADKWLTVQFFEKVGLKTPASWLPEHIRSTHFEYPIFIKPRFGSAAKNTFPVRNIDELNFFLGYIPDPILQEYLPGPEITNDVICDVDGTLLGIVSRQRIEVRWGEVAKGVTVFDPVIIQACATIARELPAWGPITVQCMLKEKVPYFTEINARLGGGVPLGIRAGVDSPLWLLARAAGIPIDIPPLGNYQVGLYMTRYDDSFFLTSDNVAQMASHRL